jgi:hypothetical protein
MRYLSRGTVAGVVILLFFCRPMLSHGQATAVDQISGTVQDSTGAAIPAAQIKALKTDTGFSRSTVSRPDGSYVLSSLPIGPYEIEVSATGFKTYKQEGVILQVNTNPSLNPVLEAGLVTQQIEVHADAQMAETQTTGISQVIDQRRVVDLPLNGRQPTQLVLLSGAAVTAPPSDLASSKNYPSSVTIAIAGGQANGTYYLLDGGDHNDAFGSINLPIPFPDLLHEFSVQTNAIPASYGERAGGVVNIVTNSGTNAFHGDLFEFLRNGAVNAKNYFASTVDQLKRNQFGGSVGGPILRDRLFFFGGYQGTITHTAPPTTTSFVPTAQVLQGDFSTLLSSTCGTPRTITDPSTGQPFPNNQIPVSRFSPQAINLLTYIPSSTDPCGKKLYSIPNNSKENQYLGRIDWTQSERHSLFGRYYNTGYTNPAVYQNNDLLLTTLPGIIDRVQSLTAGDSYTLNSSTINAFHFTWTRERINRGPASGLPSASSLGLNVAPSPGNSPQIGVSNYFSTSCGTCSVAQIYSGSKQFADDVNLIKGRHQLAVGGEWIGRYVNYKTTTQENIAYSFNGQISGNALADLLLGTPSTVIQGNPTLLNFVQNYFALYATDKIRVNSRLSVNLGVRWEPYLPEVETQNRETHFDMASFIAGTKTQVYQNAPAGLTFPGDAGFPRAGTHGHLGNFGPRVGVVWDPHGNAQTVVRAGYGVLYDLPAMQYFDRFGFGPPWASAITLNNPAGGFANPYQAYPGGNPFPLPSPPPKNATFVSAGQYINLPLNIHPTYFQQWNLSLQQQFGPDWLFSLNYIGNKGTHLWLSSQQDPAVYVPGQCGNAACSTVGNTNSRRILTRINAQSGNAFSSIIQVDDGANSSYNGMLATLNHRLQHNVSLLLNYTWSHCINEGDITSELTNTYQNPYNRAGDRGNCNTDVRQILNASLVAGTPHFTKNAAWRLLSDWELSAIVSARSGLWFSPGTGTDASLTGVGADRPNVIGNPTDITPTLKKWFDTKAYSSNLPGTYGNAGRDSLQGPGRYGVDMALFRNFPFEFAHKEQYITFRVEAFNATNHPTFANPNSTFTSANFGRILSANDPRIMQVALKYVF